MYEREKNIFNKSKKKLQDVAGQRLTTFAAILEKNKNQDFAGKRLYLYDH